MEKNNGVLSKCKVKRSRNEPLSNVANKEYKWMEISCKFRVEVKMENILAAISALNPVWNWPTEQVFCQISIQWVSDHHIVIRNTNIVTVSNVHKRKFIFKLLWADSVCTKPFRHMTLYQNVSFQKPFRQTGSYTMLVNQQSQKFKLL